MKRQINLMTVGLATIFAINACQTPEDRAREMNDQPVEKNESDNTESSMTTPGTDPATTNADTTATYDTSQQAATNNAIPPKADAVVKKNKASKGKVSIDMKSAPKSSANAGVEVMPAFPGGETSLNKFVEDNLQYPQQAIDNEVEGRVLITFDVDENGKIYRPNVVSDKIGYGLEEEALRVIKSMPQWTPGKLKGKNVKTTFTLPIVYQLI